MELNFHTNQLLLAAVDIVNDLVNALPFEAPLKSTLYVVDGLNGDLPTNVI
jgi:hypothetical protein